MKKTILILLILALLAVPVSAASPRIDDGAGLLYAEEVSTLEETAQAIYDQYGFEAVIVTRDSIGGGDPWAWANDYYDDGGFGHGETDDGMLLLLVMDTREWAVSTCGSGRDYFPDYETDFLVERILDDLSYGNYYTAFDRWLALCADTLSAPAGDDALLPDYGYDYGYDYDNGYGYDYVYDYGYGYPRQTNYFLLTAVSLVLGFLASMIPMGIMKRQIKNVRAKSGAEDYTRPGSMQLTHRMDRYLYTHTSRVRRAQNNSSSGHRSGSGGVRMSGGGGGRHGGGRGRF